MSQRLSSYLNATQELRQLSSKVDQLLSLQRHYEQIAPPSLVRASHVMQIDQQTLVIAADNGTVAAKLRQLAPGFTQLFQNGGYEIIGIQIRVQVALPISTRPPRPPLAQHRRTATAGLLHQKTTGLPSEKRIATLGKQQEIMTGKFGLDGERLLGFYFYPTTQHKLESRSYGTI